MNEGLERSVNRLVDLVSLIAICMFWPLIMGGTILFGALIYMIAIQPITWVAMAAICLGYILSSGRI